MGDVAAETGAQTRPSACRGRPVGRARWREDAWYPGCGLRRAPRATRGGENDRTREVPPAAATPARNETGGIVMRRERGHAPVAQGASRPLGTPKATPARRAERDGTSPL